MLVWEPADFEGKRLLLHHAHHGDWSLQVGDYPTLNKVVSLGYGPAHRRLRPDGSIMGSRVGRFSSQAEAQLAVEMYEDLDSNLPSPVETALALGLMPTTPRVMTGEVGSRKISICNAETMVSLIIGESHRQRPVPVAIMDQRIAFPSETLSLDSRLSQRPHSLSNREIRNLDNAIMGQILNMRLSRPSESGKALLRPLGDDELLYWRAQRCSQHRFQMPVVDAMDSASAWRSGLFTII